MNRYIFYAVLSLLLVGCGSKEDSPEMLRAQQHASAAIKARQDAENQLAVFVAKLKTAQDNEVKQREQAAIEQSTAQRIIFGLGVVAILALLIGIAVGSASRKDSGRRGNAGEPGEVSNG
jgi:hypothetical protein